MAVGIRQLPACGFWVKNKDSEGPIEPEFDFKSEIFDRLAAQIWSLSNGLNYPEFLESVIPREWTDSNLQAINQDYACFELWNPSKGFKPRVAPCSSLLTNHKACQSFSMQELKLCENPTGWGVQRLFCLGNGTKLKVQMFQFSQSDQ